MEPVTSVENKDIGLIPALNDKTVSTQTKTISTDAMPVKESDIGLQTVPTAKPKKDKKKKRTLLQKVLIKNQRRVNAENAMVAEKKATGLETVPSEKDQEPPKKKKKSNEPKPKKKRAILQPAPLNGPQNLITTVSTACNSDTVFLNAQPPSTMPDIQPSFAEDSMTAKSQEKIADITDIGIGVEKPTNSSEEKEKISGLTPALQTKESTPHIILTAEKRVNTNVPKSRAVVEKVLEDDLAKAIIVPLGKRGMSNEPILPHLPFQADAWALVVMVLGDLQDWIPDDAFQMMLGNVYWVPKCMRHTEWVYHQVLQIDSNL